MDYKLSGHVAIVTGASKGIGLAVTRTLLEEGARVIAASRKISPELDALSCPALVHVPVDLMDPDGPAHIVDCAVEKFGQVDILVNNAGGPPPGTALPRFGFLTPTDEDWRDMIEFNLFAVVRACRAAIPYLLERRGAIVNISSGLARQPAAMNVDYGAAKSGLNHVTKSLAAEYGPQGLRVNTVSPGPVRTAWWTEEGGAADILAAQVGTTREDVLETVAPTMMGLAGGRLIDPQEIADVVVLLASPRSASTSGSEFVVDAGFLKEI